MSQTKSLFEKACLIATIAAVSFTTTVLPASSASAEELTVAYFMEWPTPNQFAQTKKIYEDELGVDIKWIAMDAGTAMSAAMASGDVQISFSQGMSPFTVATSAGQDLQIVDVALTYVENEGCVVRADLEIDKSNVKELENKQVAVPLGTAAHYSFLKQMDHFGVDTSTMKIVDMAPADSAAAFASGSLDMACGWGAAFRRMEEHGNVLLNGAEKEAIGIQIFDATTVSAMWAEENAELLSKFLKITADMNAKFATGAADEMMPLIAKAAGMEEKATKKALSTITFPTIKEQLSEKWLGGGTQKFLKDLADFYVAQGAFPKALDSYESAVNASYLEAASKM